LRKFEFKKVAKFGKSLHNFNSNSLEPDFPALILNHGKRLATNMSKILYTKAET
jgi:hypothetical protein